jgi:hypothetical protein
MEFVNIRFNIFWKGGNETFQMMNNLPKSIIKDANLSLVEGATEGAFTINRSPELEDEYTGLVSFQIPTDNEKLLFEKFVGGECEKIKNSLNQLQDSKLDTKFCELEQKGVDITRTIIRETRKEFPLVKSVEVIIYLEKI